MKREIVCIDCGKALRELFPTDTPYSMEHVKFVSGLANTNYLCDQCGSTIEPLTPVIAFSSWADYGGIPYSEWENEFIKTPIQ